MPRTAREKSSGDIYHVMLRGINRQLIFQDEEDSEYFIEVLAQCSAVSGFGLYAYCLMGNHVHLLIHVKNEPLDKIMKRIGVRYVTWYNTKYERIGHLFQDRYKSEAINDNTYFMTVLRYILNNPVKARICKNSAEYSLSSASSYFNRNGITDTAFAEHISGRDSLLDFLRTPNDDICMDDTVARIADSDAIEMIRKTAGVGNPTECALMKQSQLEKLIPKLRLQRLSIHQISRLTGLTVGIIRKY